jgi:hypothetical protein
MGRPGRGSRHPPDDGRHPSRGGRNITHASDSPENGEKESVLWFKREELVSWSRDTDRWIFEK